MSADRLSLTEAEQLVAGRLGTSPRARHSRFVGLLMERLAGEVGADAGLWRIVGLVHDLDYLTVEGDWSRHGRLTAEWLAGRLLDDALAFCREVGCTSVYLWTISLLPTAARMYLAAGFRKTEEQGPSWWGREVTEERYDLTL